MQFLLILFFSLFSLTPLAGDSDQQTDRQIAVSFGDKLPAAGELNKISDLGISIIESSRPEVLTFPESQGLYLFLKAGPVYPQNHQLQIYSEEISGQIRSSILRIPELQSNRVAAVQIFEYPHEWQPPFGPLAEQIASEASRLTERPLYYSSLYPDNRFRPAGFQFISGRIPAGFDDEIQTPVVHFVPSGNRRESLKTLEHLMQESQRFKEAVIILPSEWILDITETNQDIADVISLFQNGVLTSMPLPAEESPRPPVNFEIILLILIWGSFAVHYRYQPIYSQSLMRYFTSHSFFVLDVMEDRIRNAMSGVYLLIQHTLLVGLFFCLTYELLLTENGREIFSGAFPAFIFMQNIQLNLLLIGIVLAVLLHTLSVLWIYLPNKGMSRISQAINLYSWPLHINLIIATFLVVFSQVEISHFWAVLFSVLFVLIWFFSFNITAINGAKFLDKYRILYLTGTAGAHTVLIIALVVYVLFTPAVYEPLTFAFMAP